MSTCDQKLWFLHLVVFLFLFLSFFFFVKGTFLGNFSVSQSKVFEQGGQTFFLEGPKQKLIGGAWAKRKIPFALFCYVKTQSGTLPDLTNQLHLKKEIQETEDFKHTN